MCEQIADAKRVLRATMAQRRQDTFLSAGRDAHVAAATHHLTQLLQRTFGAALGDQVLAGYMPMRSEIDPRPAMNTHPGPVCVPVITGKAMPLEFHRWTPEIMMMEGKFGASIPVSRDPLVPTVMIVPLLAFDRRGFRLGYGGGFYDRTLAGLREQGAVFAMGLAFSLQEIDEVPTTSTDQALDAVVTPGGVVM